MIINAKVTSKNQITIPKAVRDRLGINGKDVSVSFNIEPDKVTIKKTPERNLWQIVKKQEKIYGSVATPEINWGEDVGEEKFD